MGCPSSGGQQSSEDIRSVSLTLLCRKSCEQSLGYTMLSKIKFTASWTTVWPGVNHHHSAEIHTVLGYLVLFLEVWQYLVHCLEPPVLPYVGEKSQLSSPKGFVLIGKRLIM